MGGLERVVIDLIKHLSRDRWDSSLYCLKEGGSLVHELESVGCTVHELYKKDRIEYSLFWRIAKLFRQENVQIVHCHNYGALFYGAIGSRLARTRGTVYTAHGVYSALRLGKLRYARLVPVDRVIAVSADAREAALSAGPLRPGDVQTLPNGINTGLFAVDGNPEELKRELGVPEDVPVFGIVGRLSPEKQHDTLLKAMKLLATQVPGAVLIVAGDGPIRPDLESLATELDITSNVFFLGERHDVPQLLQALDVFVLSSRSEGLSIALLEAMAGGLPIVATDVGGNSEVIVDGETGLLVPPGDPEALAQAMAAVATDRERTRSMGELGRKRVNEIYSLDAMVKQYEAVYDGLLGS